MCGIVGGVAERNVVPILLEGLRRLEYRGYDSSGIAVLTTKSTIDRVRSLGKIKNLEENLSTKSRNLKSEKEENTTKMKYK